MRLPPFILGLIAPVLVCTAPLAVSTLAFNAMAAAHAETVSSPDFVKKASIANKFEIDSSKLALIMSKRDDVKEVAKRIIADHTRTGEKLMTTLESSSVKTTPQESLDVKHQKLIDELKISGAEFDARYIADQTKVHNEAVDLFTDYADKGTDPALKQFAKETLPDLKMHLKHVKELSGEK